MLNSLSTIGSQLCELYLDVPIPFPGHLNARFIAGKLFTAMCVQEQDFKSFQLLQLVAVNVTQFNYCLILA